jgi:hypothetical protein
VVEQWMADRPTIGEQRLGRLSEYQVQNLEEPPA